jgi:beta-ribofuranosylaminobenzene 5'-phosphate synthase
MSDCRVEAGARLHIGLLDLAHATPRTFGGLGVMLEAPTARVYATSSQRIRVNAPQLRQDTVELITKLLDNFSRSLDMNGIEIVVEAAPPEHVGLGSKTALNLAILTAAARVFNADLSRRELQAFSGRGGASGIGVNGFFSGGLIADAGHRGRKSLLPSSRHRPLTPPTAITCVPPPSRWVVTLFLPPGRRWSGEDEADFFRMVTPLPRAEVIEQIAIVYHGLVPAFIEDDLETFGSLLSRFSTVGMKAREIEHQSSGVRECLATLQNAAPCVGMSSMGPLVFTISRTDLVDIPRLPPGTEMLGSTGIANKGRRLLYE